VANKLQFLNKRDLYEITNFLGGLLHRRRRRDEPEWSC